MGSYSRRQVGSKVRILRSKFHKHRARLEKASTIPKHTKAKKAKKSSLRRLVHHMEK